MTKEQVLEPHVLYIRKGTFGLIAANDECSTQGALQAMQQYADQECAGKDNEIERLKGLIEKAYQYGVSVVGQHYSPAIYWKGFQEENNLY